MSGERERERERERVESHFLGGGKKGGKMDVAEVPLAEKNRFQPKGTSATWAIVMLRESKRFRYFPRSHWVILFPHLMTPNFEMCEICQRIGVFESDIPCRMPDLVAWRACSEASRAAGSLSLPLRGWILGKQREEKKATLAVVPGRREGRERSCKDVATEAMAHGSSNFKIMSHSLNKVQRVRLQNI